MAAAMLSVSGGLHMDGLSDTADGFFSGRNREGTLEIMRDSRTGAMGVMAIVVVFAVKTAALAGIPQGRMWVPVLLMPIAGRVVLVLMVAFMPYARPEGGIGTLFFERSQRKCACWCLVAFTVLSWLVAGAAGLLLVGVVLTAAFCLGVFCYRKIGGMTGDSLGASCEISETMAAVTMAAGPILSMWRT
ncbi:MAG TPA: adenosylcobinamide-GDP ribazoletransferase [Thermodesulfobacteriaceae bacterium]|nr:adenosylcobinamide-GDP ribazoletransferase [Thermodesulfobacteriaceae bacterium]